MLFNSYIFIFVFLPIVYAVFWWGLHNVNARYAWLAVTGYVFYGFWDARFCLIMAFSTLVSYLAGLAFIRFDDDPAARKRILWIPITIDLLLLGFFKYAGFGLRIASDVADSIGYPVSLPIVDIVLPIGISFYTFHTITYIVDSYRRVVRPTRNPFEFSAYVSLFSQLIAGPIVRFRQIETDLENLGHASRLRWIWPGVLFFVYGLVQKVVLADALAPFANQVFAVKGAVSNADAWAGVLAYTFQLYFDFCGYSTMAVGLGYLFGIRIPQNFNSPYKALDPSDFWQRWHISLSSTLRDYLYISLGGNRGGSLKTYRNLMITMLLGGLWHGANWTFVIWGAYHGALLIAHRLFREQWDPLPSWFKRLFMFLLVVIGWVFFRAIDLHHALHMLRAMFQPNTTPSIVNVQALAPLLLFAAFAGMWMRNAWEYLPTVRAGWPAKLSLAVAFGACLAVMASGGESPFLYFQF
jgi:alginate O-acetyltransferase complex protein AlgI